MISHLSEIHQLFFDVVLLVNDAVKIPTSTSIHLAVNEKVREHFTTDSLSPSPGLGIGTRVEVDVGESELSDIEDENPPLCVTLYNFHNKHRLDKASSTIFGDTVIVEYIIVGRDIIERSEVFTFNVGFPAWVGQTQAP